MSRASGGPHTTAILVDEAPRSVQTRAIDRLAALPYWLLLIVLAGILLLWKFTTDELYSVILGRIANGIVTTILVAVSSYALALIIGLIAGLGRVSKNTIIYNLATLYVQLIRGVPILVQLLYFAFVLIPVFVAAMNAIGQAAVPLLGAENALTALKVSTIDVTLRVVIALAVAYGGFEAETFRAGIQSIGKGQMEAARSLGMSYPQAMIYIILPQAIRRVLPPLGNDFVSMIKDSSLVSVLGVRDVTQEARLYAAASFRYLETYSTLAFVYLTLTITLSLFLRVVENRLGSGDRTA